MWHLVEFTHYGVTSNVFTNRKAKWLTTTIPLLARKNRVNTYIGSFTVRHFNTNRLLARNWRFHAKALRREVKGDVGFKRGNFSQLYAAWWTKGVLSHLRANVGAFHFNRNIKFSQSILNRLCICLYVTGVSWRLLLFKQIEAWRFPVRVADGNKCSLVFGGLIFLNTILQ